MTPTNPEYTTDFWIHTSMEASLDSDEVGEILVEGLVPVLPKGENHDNS